jgi:hypothetical protein
VVPGCPNYSHFIRSTYFFWRLRIFPYQSWFNSAFSKRCYCCRYLFFSLSCLDKRNSAHFGCPYISYKHCRGGTHRNYFPMVIPWSINTNTKALLIPDPSVNQRSTLGSAFYLAYISLL